MVHTYFTISLKMVHNNFTISLKMVHNNFTISLKMVHNNFTTALWYTIIVRFSYSTHNNITISYGTQVPYDFPRVHKYYTTFFDNNLTVTK